MKAFPTSLNKTIGMAIAIASVLVSNPTFAGMNPGSMSQGTPAPTMMKPVAKPVVKKSTIVDVAIANGSFKTLVAAVKAAGLVDTLSGVGPFTVFAPNDAAFAALPKGTVKKLLLPENKATLVKILTYHVVSGKVNSHDIKAGNVTTVEGSPVAIKVSKKHRITVGTAHVIKADVKASNGVIHVINKVLLPPDVKL
jgi:uncharacterized surface protein with fasciclin (FAS1) repeats